MLKISTVLPALMVFSLVQPLVSFEAHAKGKACNHECKDKKKCTQCKCDECKCDGDMKECKDKGCECHVDGADHHHHHAKDNKAEKPSEEKPEEKK